MEEDCITVLTSKAKNSNRSATDDESLDYKINVTEHNDENKYLSDEFAGKKKNMIGSHRSSTDSDQPALNQYQWKLIELTHEICDKQDTVANYVQSPLMVSWADPTLNLKKGNSFEQKLLFITFFRHSHGMSCTLLTSRVRSTA